MDSLTKVVLLIVRKYVERRKREGIESTNE